jgi:hypothetical protein
VSALCLFVDDLDPPPPKCQIWPSTAPLATEGLSRAVPDPWPSIGGREASGHTSRMHATSMGPAFLGASVMAGMSPLMGS